MQTPPEAALWQSSAVRDTEDAAAAAGRQPQARRPHLLYMILLYAQAPVRVTPVLCPM